MGPSGDDQIGHLKAWADFVQAVFEFFLPSRLQKPNQGIKQRGKIRLSDGLKFITIFEIAYDETKNTVGITRISSVSVDPQSISLLSAFVESSVCGF